jgi:hypothetical protein
MDKPLREQIIDLKNELAELEKQQEKLNENLLQALKDRNIDEVNKIINQGPDIKAVWHEAVRIGYPQGVKALLDAGANVNAITKYGSTALHLAAEKGDLDVVCTLLQDQKVKVNDRGENGRTPLDFALLGGYTDVAKLLRDAGANINAQDDRGETILHWFVGRSRWERGEWEQAAQTLKTLLEWGADSAITDKYGNAPLLALVHDIVHSRAVGEYQQSIWDEGRYKFLEILLENGADVNSVNHLGKTALHIAQEGNLKGKCPGKVITLLQNAQNERADDKGAKDWLNIFSGLFGPNGR